MDKKHIEYLTPELLNSKEPIWVNPVGGLGDILMLSTAMKRSFEIYNKQFCIARRSQYTDFLRLHPAVQTIGHPPVNSFIVCNDYWMRKEFQDAGRKGLEITLKIFGVNEVVSDELYFPEHPLEESTSLLQNLIPWGQKNVAIVFSSESPRKMMHPLKWHIIVEKLLSMNCFVVQLGQLNDIPIHGAYSLLGCTTPLQVMEVLKRVDLLITLDNYVMHAAQLVHTPTIALFGPTESTRYGYDKHICLQADTSHCEMRNKCLGPHVSQNYTTPCPLAENHCMNMHDENKIVDIAMSILNNK